MLAKDLISDYIPPLKVSENGLVALNWMDEFKVSHLPIINKREYIGLISDTEIFDSEMSDEPFSKCKLTLIRPYVLENQHIYEVIKMMSSMNLTVLPVLDEKLNYAGIIPANILIHQFATLAATQEPGGIIILEMNNMDYTMVQIAQIIEGNDAKILSSYITHIADSTKMEITLKLNREDLSAIIQTFIRYNYTVKASFHQAAFASDMKDRWDSFMNYLNM